MVDGGPWDNATVNDTLNMITPNTNFKVKLMTGYFLYPTPSGALIISQGLEGLKDIAALGNLSTESPTIVTFSSTGYTNCVRTDIGKLVKCNGTELTQTVLLSYDNDERKWWLSRPNSVNIGDVLTLELDGQAGQGAGTRDSTYFKNTGGGAVMIGKGYEDFNDPPRICLTNGDTLYITAGSSIPNGADAVTANLKVKDLTTFGNLTIHGNITVEGSILNLATQLASVIDSTLHTVGGFLGLNPNSSPTLAGLNLNGGVTINAPSQTGITLGNGTIYWQTATNPDVLEMNCGLIIDGALNVSGVSINGTLGITSTSLVTNLNADMLDGHHASDFVTSQWNGGTVNNAIVCPELCVTGPSCDIVMYDRNNSGQCWAEYMNGTLLRFYSSQAGADKMTLDTAGNLVISGTSTVGNLTSYGDINASGKYIVGSRNYIQWGTDTYLSNTAGNVLQINNGAGGLGVLDVGGFWVSFIVGTNGGDYSGNSGLYVFSDIICGGSYTDKLGNNHTVARNIFPYSPNVGNCGTDTYYWGSLYANYIMPGTGAGGKSIGLQTNHWAYVWADYLRYDENSQVFDALDDLALVKNYTTKTETRTALLTNQEYDVEVIDVEKSLPHLLDEFGMRSPSRDIGFLLGCAKFEVLAREKLEQQVRDLQLQVEELQRVVKNND